MKVKLTWGKTAGERVKQTVYAKGLADKVQESLDKQFGKSSDCYGHWKTIEQQKKFKGVHS